LVTDDQDNATETEAGDSQDDFDKPLEVDTGTPPPGDREQRLSAPNLTDPSSRTTPDRVPAHQAILDAEGEDRRNVRKKLVWPVLVGAAVQFVAADVAFFIYGYGNDWQIHPSVMVAWLSATVVQVVGVVLVVMRYLFPGPG